MQPSQLYEEQYGKNKLKSDYASFPLLRRLFRAFDLYRNDAALSFLGSGDRILDVGCGDGELLFRLRDRYRHLVGTDLVEKRLQDARDRFAKESLSGRSEFFASDISHGLKFAADSFDAVVFLAVLEHLFDPFAALDEIHRVLKPGGILVVEVPNIAYIKNRVKLLFGKLPATATPNDWHLVGWDGGHLHYFTQKTLKNLLRYCGFEPLKTTGTGLFAVFRRFYPALLTGDLCIKAKKIERKTPRSFAL